MRRIRPLVVAQASPPATVPPGFSPVGPHGNRGAVAGCAQRDALCQDRFGNSSLIATPHFS
jgi:hypothetical protein